MVSLGTLLLIGVSFTWSAPEISGYTTPSPATQSFVLGASTNSHTFVYNAASGTPTTPSTEPAQTPQQLANTGTKLVLVTSAAGGTVLLSSIVWRKRLKLYVLSR